MQNVNQSSDLSSFMHVKIILMSIQTVERCTSLLLLPFVSTGDEAEIDLSGTYLHH